MVVTNKTVVRLILSHNPLQGKKWMLLANEEVPSMIMAITGRRGRPPNPDKEKPRRARGMIGGPARRPGRPPKPKMIDLLSKVDAKLLKRLEAKGGWKDGGVHPALFAYRSFKSVLQLIVCDPPFVEALTEEEKEKLAKIKKKMKRKVRV